MTEISFPDALRRLRAGDYTAIDPLFHEGPGGTPCRIVAWHDEGRFAGAPDALAEAFTCACFLGAMDVVENLLARGCNPAGGAATGADGLHWAANRGNLDVVRILVDRGAPLESRNRFGGTVLGMAAWSAAHEPRADHRGIMELLIRAGARVQDAGYPTGSETVDAFLARFLPLPPR